VFTLDILPRGDWIGDISLFLFRLIAASFYPLLSDKCLGAFSYCSASVIPQWSQIVNQKWTLFNQSQQNQHCYSQRIDYQQHQRR
jgi:hypothetical protein